MATAAHDTRASRAVTEATARIAALTAALPAAARTLPLGILGALPRSALRAIDAGGFSQINDCPALGGVLATARGCATLEARLQELDHAVRALGRGQRSSGELLMHLLGQPLLALLLQRAARLPAAARRVVYARSLASTEPASLLELGRQLDEPNLVVRRLEAQALATLDPQGLLRGLVDERLARLRRGRTEPLTIALAAAGDPLFVAADRTPRRFAHALTFLGCSHSALPGADGVVHADAPLVPGSVRWFAQLLTAVRRELGASRDGEQARRLTAARLEEHAASDLLPLALERLGGLYAGREQLLLGPMLVDRIEAVLAAAGGPLTFEELRQRIVAEGGSHKEDKLYPALLKAMERNTVARVAPGLFVCTDLLIGYEPQRANVRRFVLPRLQRAGAKGLTAVTLLAQARAAGEPWAAEVPACALEFLVRDAEGVSTLRHGRLALAAARRAVRGGDG